MGNVVKRLKGVPSDGSVEKILYLMDFNKLNSRLSPFFRNPAYMYTKAETGGITHENTNV